MPPRDTASAHPALRSWTLAVAVHGGIAALLLAGTFASPKPQPEQPPVFEIVLPAAQPLPEPPVPQPAPAAAVPPEPVAVPEPEPEPEPLPEPEPQIEAPTPKPVVKPRPRPAQPAAQPQAETQPSVPVAASAPMQPVSAPAPPQPPAPAQAMPPYAPILLDWLGRHRDYPRAARLRRQEGIPRIALTLDRSGRLLHLELREASGHDLLDQAALDMARRAAPFPPPQLPPGSEKATFIVPVQFHLERR